MLAGLQEIDWAELKHAYGSAADLPGHLRALSEPSQSERALQALYGNVFHQGTRYTATPPTIGFVVELACEPATPARAALLSLAVNLGLGYEEGFLPIGLSPAEFQEAVEQAEASIGPEDRAYLSEHGVGPAVDLACYRALNTQVDRIQTLLTDEDPQVRSRAAYALAWFPTEGCTTGPLLEERLQAEEDPALVANLILCLGILAQQSHHEIEAAPMRAALASEHLVLRVAAAIALAPLGMEPDVLAALIEGSKAGEALQVHGLPWNGGDLSGYVSVVLAVCGREYADQVVPALCAALEAASAFASLDLTQSILHLVQPEAGFSDAAQLSPLAREALTHVQLQGGWEVDGAVFANFSGLLRSYELPDTPTGLQAYLAEGS